MRRLTGLILLTGFFALSSLAADTEEQQKIETAVEALTRLQNVNLEEKPAIRAAVDRVLARTRGTPNFVRLVQHFKLTNQNSGLLEVALQRSQEDSGVTAMRALLANQQFVLLQETLRSSNMTDSVRAAEALGNTKDKDAVPLLLPLVQGDAVAPDVQRMAVRGLVQTLDGAKAVLNLAREDNLPDRLKLLASSELNAARWPAIKQQAAEVLPLPAGHNAQPLPPISELIKMKGDAVRGADVFRREAAACALCHQVGNTGRDVGPALTEIGDKLAREAMYEAVLDPNAGISFGYEAWQVELKSGDEAYGLKASETPEEIAIKDTNGIVTRYKRADIASLRQMKSSIMPAGLQQTMTTQDLVDLIEYLASLKKLSP